MMLESPHKFSQGGDSALQRGRHPVFQKLPCRAEVFVIPEVFELVLEYPCAVDPAIGGAEFVEHPRMPLGAIAGVHSEQPAQALDGLAFVALEFVPLLLAHGVDRFVEGLDHMEAVDHQHGGLAMMLDGLRIGAAHVAACPADPAFLPVRELFLEELIDCGSPLSLSHPQDTGSVQVVDDRRVFPAFAVGDFVDAQGDQAANLVAGSGPRDDPVEDVGYRRAGHIEDCSRRFLGHDLAKSTDPILQPIGDAGPFGRPGDLLLDTAVGGTVDLLGRVMQDDLDAKDGDIGPGPIISSRPDDRSAPAALRAQTPVFKRFHPQMELKAAIAELKPGDFHLLQA